MKRKETGLPAESYRVAPGRVAMTFDIEPHDPSTIEINAAGLTDVVAEVGKRITTGWSYERACKEFCAMYEAAKKGRHDAQTVCCWVTGWHSITQLAAPPCNSRSPRQ